MGFPISAKKSWCLVGIALKLQTALGSNGIRTAMGCVSTYLSHLAFFQQCFIVFTISLLPPGLVAKYFILFGAVVKKEYGLCYIYFTTT